MRPALSVSLPGRLVLTCAYHPSPCLVARHDSGELTAAARRRSGTEEEGGHGKEARGSVAAEDERKTTELRGREGRLRRMERDEDDEDEE